MRGAGRSVLMIESFFLKSAAFFARMTGIISRFIPCDFFEPTRMPPFAGEGCREPCFENTPRERPVFCHCSCAEAEYICIVVFAGHFCGIRVVAERGSRAFDFVGGNTFADARAAENDAERFFVFGHRSRGGNDKIRIIVGRVKIARSKIPHRVSGGFQKILDALFHLEGGVIGGEGDSHIFFNPYLA